MNRASRLLLAGLVTALSLAQVAFAGPDAPAVPTDIKVPAGHKLYLIGHATGVQIFSCTGTGGSYGWSFVAPRAELVDDNGKLLATHGAGPHWLARDGSKVFATLDKRVTVDPTAIPWLRLLAVSPTAGSYGDRLAGTTYIQRIATTGGLAPVPATCNESTVGTVEEVPYTADYTFWKSAS